MATSQGSSPHPLPAFGRSGVWRAQLLWMLEAAAGDPAAVGRVLGFGEGESVPVAPEPVATTDVQDIPDSPPLPDLAAPLPAVRFLCVERDTQDDAPAAAVAEVREPEWYAAATVLSDDPVPSPGSVARPAFQPLHRAARFNPFLRRQLGAYQPGSMPDLRRLLRAAERGEVPRHLPLLARRTWAPTAHLLLDLSTPTQPYHSDFRALVAALQAQRGAPGLQVSVLADGPGRHPWVRAGRGHYRRFTAPDGQTPLLVLSDLGAGGRAGNVPGVRIGWEAFGRQLRAAGCRPIALSPLPPQGLTPVLRQLFRAFHWDRHVALKASVKPAVSLDACDPTQRAAHAETVLALGAPAIFLEPALIRALRLLVAGADGATESAAWWHADVRHGSGAAVAYAGLDVRTRYQDRFRALPPALQRQAIDAIRAHHATHATSIRMIEAETAARLMDGQDAAAADWHADAARTLREAETPNWAAWRARHLNRQSPALWAGNRPLAALWVSAHAEALYAGRAVLRPEGLDETDLAFFLGIGPVPRIRQAFLRQVGPSLVLDKAATGFGAVLSAFRLDTDVLRIDRTTTDGEITTTLVPVTALPQTLAHLTPGLERIGIRGLAQHLRLRALPRPAWARAIGRDADGLYVVILIRGVRHKVSLPMWARDLDMDAFGLYADFTVQGVTQRCRWIAPGTFQMGSPPDEPERVHDETQHAVTLSRGYWLADTACTQALWQAVMGDNPSHFKGDPMNPVEQVSWNDVQTFFERLNEKVPGLDAGLPSEAQWEYACRAGTTTPFSFGEHITPEQVNYNGNHPYANGKKGLYRERTVPVKSLPPNPWGLYEMHGNVWEWCSDWFGVYPAGSQIDPSGPPEGIGRVLRGGSWINGGQFCRAAYRYGDEPDDRGDNLGFRLAPGQRPGPAGHKEAARGARGASAPRSGVEQAPAERAGPAAGRDAGGGRTKQPARKGRQKP